MSGIFDLLTKIIIFVTSLVGLYKGVKYSPSRRSTKSSDDMLENLGPLPMFIGIFGSILIVPLFIFLFNFLIHSTSELHIKKSETIASYQTYENEINIYDLSKEDKSLYLLFLTALNVGSIKERDNLLEDIVSHSMESKSFEMGILAVENIKIIKKKEDLLDKLIKTANDENLIEVSVRLLSLYSTNSAKEKAAKQVFAKINVNLEDLKKGLTE